MPQYNSPLVPAGTGDEDWCLVRSRDTAIPSPMNITSIADAGGSPNKVLIVTPEPHGMSNGDHVKIICNNLEQNDFNGSYVISEVTATAPSFPNWTAVYNFKIESTFHTIPAVSNIRIITPPAASISDTALFPVDTAGNANQSETTYITAPTLAAYLDDEITAMPNLVSIGILNVGSITSGFGSINNGTDTITTTGAIAGGSFTIGGHSIDDIDLATEFVDADDHLMSSAAIQDKILSYNYQATLTFGISNGNALQVVEETTAVSGEYAKFVPGGIAGVSTDTMKIDLGISDISHTYAIAIALG
jgi:hypothetical protein